MDSKTNGKNSAINYLLSL